MKTVYIVLSLLFISFFSSAKFENIDYTWEKNPVRHKLTASEEQEKSVKIKDVHISEYTYNDAGSLEMIVVVHKIIRVNNDAAVNENNKVFISMAHVIDLVELKVRSISKTGKITELTKSNIKEIENAEKDQSYKIFAIEGVEVGSEIEYLYILKRSPKRSGREYVQSESLNKDITIKIISPDNLIFETKSFNGFPELKDTVYDKKRYLTIDHAATPALLDEAFANYERNRMRVEFRLSYNKFHNEGKTKLNTYADATKNIFANTHPADDKSDKAILKLINTIGLPTLNNTEDKIKAVEKYVKNNFVIVASSAEQFKHLPTILKGKQAVIDGIVILYNRIFELGGIKYQMVLTSDRMVLPFDSTFESYDYLTQYAYYFPDTDKFFAPGEIGMRYPMIPDNWIDNYGLFITPVILGEIKSAVCEVKFIPENIYTETYDNLDIAISFNIDNDKVLLDLTRSLGGYSGNAIVAIYDDLSDDDKSKVLKSLAESTLADAQMITGEAKNTDRNICTFYSPLILHYTMESTNLLQSAGNKFIFNVGQVIGEQSQLYQEKERKQPVENDNNHMYIRKIVVTIPDGYTLSNLDKLKFFQQVKESNGKASSVFKSDYTLNGNKLTISIEEYYSKIQYPLSKFEEFRKVVNAAADFNKVTIVLQKK